MEWITNRVFVVAEMSANHKQDFGKACDIIYAASQTGADAVKVQMFKPELGDNSRIRHGLWAGKTLRELYKKACMPYKWVPKLKELSAKIGIKFFTSVYDIDTVDLCEAIGIEAYKISSFEACDNDLIKKVASTDKPVIVSTGLSSFSRMVEIYRMCPKAAFLKCTSSYPAKLDDMNLRTILDMNRAFSIVGLSDHTDGITAPLVAVAMGAKIIEKHITIDDDTLDAAFSIKPERFAVMVQAIRATEKAMGKVVYGGKSDIVRKDGKRRIKDVEG